MSWFTDKVLNDTDIDGGVGAKIEWEVECENNKNNKITTQVLTGNGWKNYCLGQNY